MMLSIKDDGSLYSACSSSSSSPVSSENNQRSSVSLDAPEICSGWRHWTRRYLSKINDLVLEVPMGNTEGITIQGSFMGSNEQALGCVEYIISRIDVLRNLSIKFCGSSVSMLNVVLDYLLQCVSDKVHLETVTISGRRGGLRTDRLSLLMAKCANTLKIAGFIGVSELEGALSSRARFNLEKLSLTNHDLLNEMEGINGLAGEMREAFVRICSGNPEIFVKHLSVLTVNGFNPAVDPYNHFLRHADVCTLNISLHSGDLLDPSDVTPARVLPSVRSFAIESFQNRLRLPVSFRSLFPSLMEIYVNSLEIPLKGLEQAFAYAAEWLSMYTDKKLNGVLSTEVHYEYDPASSDKIRCHLDDIERCGGKLQLLTTDTFCRCAAQFIVSNADCSFQFKIHCTSDIWVLADLLDFEFSSVRSVA
ncbi:unnamed protein product [Enterobius vermicularis]|uniref:F-box domain-containing protein n=1 Tax=Enterobius vermicularis TaxID=51028 RepID=A0A0N4V9Q1_ENTVE|nr:unnamed protein product [Enterobius vermicularis]